VDEITATRPAQGHKFSLSLLDATGTGVGVAIVARPVARHLDDGWTLEFARLATDGTPNACSALHGAAWRTTRGHDREQWVTSREWVQLDLQYTQAQDRKLLLIAAIGRDVTAFAEEDHAHGPRS
jgi:hypothetical protein